MHRMPNTLRAFAQGLALAALLLPSIWTSPVLAVNLSGAQMVDFTAFPVTTLENVTPQVMLVMSRDHQYFFKAYNDYTDLDGDLPNGDPDIESTYENSFSYYGYFDPDKCYSYTSDDFGSGDAVPHFEPQAFTTDHYCDAVAGEWSGNFLNWATMTRMDIVRKMIYGGKRAIDLPDATVLERAHLPTDAHAFAKYYAGTDIGQLTPFDSTALPEGLTICNTTFANSGQSHTTEEPPLMRLARGNFALWAAGEVFQCNYREELSNAGHGRNGNDPAASGLAASPDSPSRATHGLSFDGTSNDWQVRVAVCNDPALIASSNDNENCRRYPTSSNFKPIGLYQEFGENEQIHFGLFTGSYEQNISGGVLRKNIGPVGSEVNYLTDGTFDLSGSGLVSTLDRLRIYGYNYGSRNAAARYFGTGSSDTCGFQQASIAPGQCFSWGNPMAETYAEAVRYFAGLSATTAFQANDGNRITGLTSPTWTDPLDNDKWCAGLNTVVINSSLSSYDEDTGHFADLGGSPDAIALTNAVGDAEGITGREFFVGRVGAAGLPGNDELCTAKTVSGLGEVVGVCPEGPTIDGTYRLAGMAHYAHTQDIRPTLEGEQLVTTYAVQLATNVPRLEVDVDRNADSDGDGNAGNDADVTILPAYRLLFNNGGGTLVDFKIVQPETEVPGEPGVYAASAMVQWEDSEQGGDFDKDMWGVISYRVDTTASPPEVTISTNAVEAATANAQLFGFIVSGTTQDGFHAYSGIFSANFADPITGVPGCTTCNAVTQNNATVASGQRGPQQHTFTAGGTGAALLPDPLFLAAKYGGFERDENDNGLPDLQSEFDSRDVSGRKVAGGDGIPDNFFFVSNPAALEERLRTVFNQVIERVASGTAASVVASEEQGTGAAFQALYDPIKSDDVNEVRWIGTLHAIFVDEGSFLREDSNDNDTLDDYQTDQVIEIFYDETVRRARLRRFDSSSADEFEPAGFEEVELAELNPIWNAREQLSATAAANDLTTQRLYGEPADTGRFIFTWLDLDRNGLVGEPLSSQAVDTTGEILELTDTVIDTSNFHWLDVRDGTAMNDVEADKLVNWIRGVEQDGYRNRVVDYDADGTTERLLLGDIVNSTPTAVGAPQEDFDLASQDQSYAVFRQQYRDRRTMVYVGANDGMLHAFNGGFFNAQTNTFETSIGGRTGHPLGSEVWAYVPKNLLGHLQWLAEEDYAHVYYMDLKPVVFDAKIFPSDSTHPGGWGTVLVAGMRLGGGSDLNGVTLDTAGDGVATPPAADDVVTKSAYVLLDITDPEQAPKVIAEISPPGLGFTTSTPVAVPVATPLPTIETTPPNKWYLLFGSGPDDLGTVSASGSARLFAYDLEELVDGNDGVVENGPFNGDGVSGNGVGFADTGEANTFVGELTVADQDIDMRSEVVYFGTVGDVAADRGSFYRMNLNEDDSPSGWDEPFTLLDVDQPFATRAAITVDDKFRTWIIAGTGRLFTNADKQSDTTQSLYGFIDQYSIPGNPGFDPGASNPAPLDHTDFIDTTAAITRTDGGVDIDADGTQDVTYAAYESIVADAGG
ncbi:MAG: PilC/PilY family type IV pilus protein, partial [Gammaproteobacteria bacterium]